MNSFILKKLSGLTLRLFALSFLLAVFPALLFAQDASEGSGFSWASIVAWFQDYGWILLAIWEIITKAVPGWEQVSLLRIIGGIVDVLVPNRTADGGLITTYDTGKMAELGEMKTFQSSGSWFIFAFPFLIAFGLVLWGVFKGGFFGTWVGIIAALAIAFVIQWVRLFLNGRK